MKARALVSNLRAIPEAKPYKCPISVSNLETSPRQNPVPRRGAQTANDWDEIKVAQSSLCVPPQGRGCNKSFSGPLCRASPPPTWKKQDAADDSNAEQPSAS